MLPTPTSNLTLTRRAVRAVYEFRRQLVASDKLLTQMPRCSTDLILSAAELAKLADLIAQKLGGVAFVWNSDESAHQYIPAQTATIQ